MTIRHLTGVVVQRDGVDVLSSPNKLNFTGSEIEVIEDPSGVAKISGQPTRDLNSVRHVGTSPFARHYIAGQVTTQALTTVALADGTLYAVPLIESRGSTIDRIAISVTTSRASSCRLGIYRNTSLSNLYQSTLLADFGTVSVSTTGFKELTISQVLEKNTLYWAVVLAQTNPGLTAVPLAAMYGILGSDVGGGQAGVGYSVAQAWGVLPSTFPAGATINTTAAMAAIFHRFSA